MTWSLVSVAAVIGIVGSPVAHRLGWLPLGPAFLILLLSVVVSFITVVVGIVAAVRDPTAVLNGRSLITYLISVGAVIGPLWAVVPALGKPAIHDITTDTTDPPQFNAVIPLRSGSPNSVEYAGAELARMQQAAYPDLTSLVLTRSASEVLQQVEAVAQELNWNVVAIDTERGQLEATDTTFWFGFKDDVVVRIRQNIDGDTRIDVRSTSRVGVGDLGANADRIRNLLSRLRSRN